MAELVAPVVGAVVTTVSSITGFGEHVAGPAVDGVSKVSNQVAGVGAQGVIGLMCPTGCGGKN